MHRSTRTGAGTLVAVVLAVLLGWAGTAAAHVESTPAGAEGATDDAGITTIVFSFDHGCDGSPTTALRVQLGEQVTEPVPVDPAGWTSSIGPAGTSGQVLEWSGGSVPDGEAGRFELRARVVGTEGDVVYFPTVQQCAEGEHAWIEVPERGADEPENPAPSITLSRTVEAEGGPVGTTPGTGATASTTTTARSSAGSLLIEEATTEGPAAGTEPGTMGLVVLLVVMAIIGGGALVLYLRHRRPRTENPEA